MVAIITDKHWIYNMCQLCASTWMLSFNSISTL